MNITKRVRMKYLRFKLRKNIKKYEKATKKFNEGTEKLNQYLANLNMGFELINNLTSINEEKLFRNKNEVLIHEDF